MPACYRKPTRGQKPTQNQWPTGSLLESDISPFSEGLRLSWGFYAIFPPPFPYASQRIYLREKMLCTWKPVVGNLIPTKDPWGNMFLVGRWILSSLFLRNHALFSHTPWFLMYPPQNSSLWRGATAAVNLKSVRSHPLSQKRGPCERDAPTHTIYIVWSANKNCQYLEMVFNPNIILIMNSVYANNWEVDFCSSSHIEYTVVVFNGAQSTEKWGLYRGTYPVGWVPFLRRRKSLCPKCFYVIGNNKSLNTWSTKCSHEAKLTDKRKHSQLSDQLLFHVAQLLGNIKHHLGWLVTRQTILSYEITFKIYL